MTTELTCVLCGCQVGPFNADGPQAGWCEGCFEEPPVGSIVIDQGGRPWLRERSFADDGWICVYAQDWYPWLAVQATWGPVRLIHQGRSPADWTMNPATRDPGRGCDHDHD